jgi:hypothetical protein
MPEESVNSLNSNHERRLSVTCRYVDKLLADMESILSVLVQAGVPAVHSRSHFCPATRGGGPLRLGLRNGNSKNDFNDILSALSSRSARRNRSNSAELVGTGRSSSLH